MNIRRMAAASASVLILSASIVATTALSASAATSAANLYLYNGGDGTAYTGSSTIPFGEIVVATSKSTKAEAFKAANKWVGPSDSDEVDVFVSPVGQEGTKNSWLVYANTGETTTTYLPAVGFANQTTQGTSSLAAIQSNGGTFSLGFAFLKNGQVNGNPYFTTVTVAKGSGDWTYTYPAAPAPFAPSFANYSATSGASAVIKNGNLIVNAGSANAGKSVDVWAEGTSTAVKTGVTLSSTGSAIISPVPTGISNGTRLALVSNSTVVAWTATSTYQRTEPDATADAATKVTVADPAPNATTVVVPAGASNANKTFSAYGFSSPVSLGQVTTDANGNATVNFTGLQPGQHKVALYDANDNLIAWGTFTIPVGANQGQAALTVKTDNTGVFSLSGMNPTIDLGTARRGQTTAVAQLGDVKVVDDRDQLKGWTVTTTVDTFKSNGLADIPNSALGLKVGYKDATNFNYGDIVLGSEQVAGSAVYGSKFAEAPNGSTVAYNGAVFTGGLTFKAPTSAQKGTYTSTLTLTLASK